MNLKRVFRGWFSRRRLTVAVNAVLAGLACSFMGWDPLEIDDRAKIRRTTLQTADNVSAAVARDFRADVSELHGLVGPRDDDGIPSGAQWQLRSQFFLETHPEYVALLWIQPDGQTRHAHGSKGGVYGRKVDVASAAQLTNTLATASSTSADAVFSPVFTLPNARRAADVVVPIRTADRLMGFVVGIVDTTAALEATLRDHDHAGYAVAVHDNTEEIFRTSAHAGRDRAWQQHAALTLPGVMWRIQVWPHTETVEDMRSAVPELALVLMTLLVLNFGMAFVRAPAAPPDALRRANLRRDASALSINLLRVQDEERRRIARELHDSTAQTLGAAAMALAQARALTDNAGAPQLEGALRESAELLDAATLDLRTQSYLLHPPMLDEFGLEYALAAFCEGFATRSGLTVRVEIQPDIGRFPANVELALFRVAQEALTNVYRHSGSRTADVTLRRDGERIVLEIADQGRGVATSAAFQSGVGVGMASMRERVRELGGRFDIADSHGRTTLRAALPLAAAGASRAQVTREADESHL